jgi:short-subunit dehydrogenase
MGLGRAIAVECASRGLDLVLVALPDSGLPEVCATIARDTGAAVDWLEADLTEKATLDAVIALVRSKDIDVELLVNNAGIGGVGLFMDLPLAHHEAAIRLNALALMSLTRLVVSEFGDSGRLRVLNVASLGAFYPMPTLSVYSATKSFVLDFSLALRAELAPAVSVSVLCPNAIRTNQCVDDYVDGLGLASRLACMAPEDIARIALDGVERGRAVIVPGRFNRALAVLSRFVPRSIVMRAIRHYWGGFAERDESVRALAPGGEAGSAKA